MGGSAPHRSTAHAGGQVQVKEISDKYHFLPPSIQVTAGDTVTWTNNSDVSHTVTSDSGAFNTNPFGEHATVTLTFRTAGTFAYHCSIHRYMHGVVIVQAATTGAGGLPSGVANTGGGGMAHTVIGLPRSGGASSQSGNGAPLLPIGGLLGALMIALGLVLRRRPLRADGGMTTG